MSMQKRMTIPNSSAAAGFFPYFHQTHALTEAIAGAWRKLILPFRLISLAYIALLHTIRA